MKARTQAGKRRAKLGRPRKEGAIRTASGQISRGKGQMSIELEAATWKRRRENPALSIDEARKPEHGSVIDRWLVDHQRFVKRYPGAMNPHEFTQLHYDCAMKFHALHVSWLAAIEAKRLFSSTDLSRMPGRDGTDPFSERAARQHSKTERNFKEARRAVLESAPFGMMAIEAIVIENQPAENLRGDLRLALNRLAVLWKHQSAA